MQAQLGRRRARPLRCGSSRDTGGGRVGGGAGAAAAGEHVCRICWDGSEGEGNRLVEPCACSGSMRYVHAQCLAHWQQQLRAQKGLAAARRCDICKAPFARAHQLPSGPTHWRLLLRDVLRRVPWPAVLECWKFSVIAIGAVQGMQAGLAGLRSGAQWAAGSSRARVEGLARWAPEMALAAGTVPPLKVRARPGCCAGAGAALAGAAGRAGMARPALPAARAAACPAAPARPPLPQVPMALALATFVTGLAAQVAVVSLVCAYAGR